MPIDDLTGLPLDDSFGQVLHGPEGYIPFRRTSTFALGCDLGQSVDPTAIAVVERVVEAKVPREIGGDLFEVAAEPRFECRYLSRLPLQTSYPAIINHVGNLLTRAPLRGNCRLVADATGVGRPILELFERAGLDPVAVTITSGDSETMQKEAYDWWRVSKMRLVGQLQALLHSRLLRISKSQPEAAALAMELADFRATFTDAGNAIFGARTGRHDDLVLALAIACWWLARHGGPNFTIEPFPIT